MQLCSYIFRLPFHPPDGLFVRSAGWRRAASDRACSRDLRTALRRVGGEDGRGEEEERSCRFVQPDFAHSLQQMAQPAKPQPAKPQPTKPMAPPAKPQPAKPQPAKPQPAKPQPAKQQPAKPQPKPKPQPPAVETESRLVMALCLALPVALAALIFALSAHLALPMVRPAASQGSVAAGGAAAALIAAAPPGNTLLLSSRFALPLQHFAARRGLGGVINPMTVRWQGLEAADKQGQTALHLAAQFGKIAVIRKLLQAGADPHARDRSGWTVLSPVLVTLELQFLLLIMMY